MNNKLQKLGLRIACLLAFLGALNGCASYFSDVVEISPGIYAIGDPETDATSDSMLRAGRISEATLFCTKQRSSMVLVPDDQQGANNDGASTAYVKFQCTYFKNDAQ